MASTSLRGPMNIPAVTNGVPLANPSKVSSQWRRFRTGFSERGKFPFVVFELKRREADLNAQSRRPQIQNLIVSLTTMPGRINRVHFTIRSLLAQTVQPEKIILYISEPELREEPLSRELLVLKETSEIFSIRLTEKSFRSYDKIVHVLESFPGMTIVTCDDDKIYPPCWLEKLVEGSENEPNTVICHQARWMPLTRTTEPPAYEDWHPLKENRKAYAILPIGVGGILYPPGSLHPETTDKKKFLDIAPYTDDLWLKFMTLRNSVKARRLDVYQKHPPSIPTPWNTRLMNRNIARSGNYQTFQRLMEIYSDELDGKNLLEQGPLSTG